MNDIWTGQRDGFGLSTFMRTKSKSKDMTITLRTCLRLAGVIVVVAMADGFPGNDRQQS